MQTILWLVNFVGALACGSFSLYFYLSHDDLDKGLIEPLELSEQMSKFLPIEIYIHSFITLFCFLNGNWFLFLYNLPLLISHWRMLMKRQHVFHIITIGEYKDKKKNQRFLTYKLVFYILLIILLMLRFMYALSNLIIFRLLGKTYTLFFFS